MTEALHLPYQDLYMLPYSRRQRLVEWKEARDKKREQMQEAQRRRKR